MPKVARKSPVMAASAQNQIAGYVRERIHKGEWEPGARLPSIRSLARQFDVSQVPAHIALIQLEKEGLVKRIHGSGVVVTFNRSEAKRTHPLVKMFVSIDNLIHNLSGRPRAPRHTLPAVQEWEVWQLSQSDRIRLQLVPVSTAVPIEKRAEEALEDPASVLTFCEPEFLRDDQIRALRQLNRRGCPVVYLATRTEIEDFDRVHMDFTDGQYQLTRHLIRQGHRQIVRFVTDLSLFFEKQKQSGYQKALEEIGVSSAEARERICFSPESDDRQAEFVQLREQVARLMKEFKPTAIMAVNDPQAAIVRLVLNELHHHNIEVTGYDANWKEINWTRQLQGMRDSHISKVGIDTPPTSVDTHLPDAGKILSQLVIERAEGKLPLQPQVRLVKQNVVLAQ